MLGLIGLVVTSTVVLMWIETWSFFDALYFTLITITTVGYDDQGLSGQGRWMAGLLMTCGIATLSYVLALMVHATQMTELRRRKRMQQRIDGLEKHTIVCGFGRMAAPLCRALEETGSPFVVIEARDDGFERARELGYAVLRGSATEDATLRAAGIDRADWLLAGLDDASDNIVTVLSARALSAEISIIARSEQAEDERKLERAGATQVIHPYEIGGLEVAHRILRPDGERMLRGFVQVDGDLMITEVEVQPDSALDGVRLSEYGRAMTGVSFIALRRPGKTALLQPRGDTELGAGDVLIVAGEPAQLHGMRAAAIP